MYNGRNFIVSDFNNKLSFANSRAACLECGLDLGDITNAVCL
jgi:hypothetical protein